MRKRPPPSERATQAKLRGLGPEQLSDALLKLAEQSDEAEALVGRLTATTAERIQRFKRGLTGVRRRKRFIRWGETGAYARELRYLLDELRPGVDDPKTGVKLVASFIKSDEAVFRAIDDSSGSVGDVFRLDAREHFARFAAECEDKDWVADQVFELSRQDDYGVRDAVVEVAGQYLPEPVLRDLAQRMWSEAQATTPPKEKWDDRDFRRRHWLILVGLLPAASRPRPL